MKMKTRRDTEPPPFPRLRSDGRGRDGPSLLLIFLLIFFFFFLLFTPFYSLFSNFFFFPLQQPQRYPIYFSPWFFLLAILFWGHLRGVDMDLLLQDWIWGGFFFFGTFLAGERGGGGWMFGGEEGGGDGWIGHTS